MDAGRRLCDDGGGDDHGELRGFRRHLICSCTRQSAGSPRSGERSYPSGLRLPKSQKTSEVWRARGEKSSTGRKTIHAGDSVRMDRQLLLREMPGIERLGPVWRESCSTARDQFPQLLE